MGREIRKVISIIVCISFLFSNSAMAQYEPATQNLSAELGTQDPEFQEVMKAAAGRFTAMKYTDALELTDYPDTFIISDTALNSPIDMGSFKPADYKNIPEDWENFSADEWNTYRGGERTDSRGNELPENFLQLDDPITALEFFMISEARIPPYRLNVIEGWFPCDIEKGELPIARIEPKNDNSYTIVVHTDFVQKWKDLRKNDVWFKHKFDDGKVRTISYAWSILFWAAKHEMADISKRGGIEKGGGHYNAKDPLKGEEAANLIGGRYAEINESLRLAFLHGYCIDEPSSYTEDGFKSRARWVLSPSSKDAPVEKRLEEEFPILSAKKPIDREVDIHRAFLAHYYFSTQFDENGKVIGSVEYASDPDYIKKLKAFEGDHDKRLEKIADLEERALKATGSTSGRTIKRVLYVEDDASLRRLMSLLLKSMGGQGTAIEDVTAVSSLEEAEQAIRKSIEDGQNFDMILTDGEIGRTERDSSMSNPNATGIEVVLAARQFPEYENIPAVLLSGRKQKEIEERYAVLSGKPSPEGIFAYYLAKPASKIQLIEVIKEIEKNTSNNITSATSSGQDYGETGREAKQPELLVFEDGNETVKETARRIVEAVKKKPDLVLGLATGGTQIPVYKEIIRLTEEQGVDWSRVTTFNLDEYAGVTPDHAQSYRRYMNENLFNELSDKTRFGKKALNIDNTHIPDGEAEDLEREMEEYADMIRSSGGVDLWLIGMGSDGHYAFLEPAAVIDARFLDRLRGGIVDGFDFSSGAIGDSPDGDKIRDFNEFYLSDDAAGEDYESVKRAISDILGLQEAARNNLGNFEDLIDRYIASMAREGKTVSRDEAKQHLSELGDTMMEETERTFYVSLTPEEVRRLQEELEQEVMGSIRIATREEYFGKPAKVVNLAIPTLIDNARYFDNINEVPLKALTTVGVVMESKSIVQHIVHEGISNALKDALELSQPTPECPSTILRTHSNWTVIATRAAASKVSKEARARFSPSTTAHQEDGEVNEDDQGFNIPENLTNAYSLEKVRQAGHVIGVPKEIKPQAERVGLTPKGVRFLTSHGVRVVVELGAGRHHFSDREYIDAGAKMVNTAKEVWRRATIIKKVKEPLKSEYEYMRRGQMIFTYLHLASPELEALAVNMVEKKVTGIAYETIETVENGKKVTPALKPMSIIAGDLGAYYAAVYLNESETVAGADGKEEVVLSDVGRLTIDQMKKDYEGSGRAEHFEGSLTGKEAVVLGGGVSGESMARRLLESGAKVTITDVSEERLEELKQIFAGYEQNLTLTIVPRNINDISPELMKKYKSADILGGCILLPGGKAPQMSKQLLDYISRDKKKVIIDIALDQGGNFYDSHSMSHEDPVFIDEFGNKRFCVPNIPDAVGKRASVELEKTNIAYTLALAMGVEESIDIFPELKGGINTLGGSITHDKVAEAYPTLPRIAQEDAEKEMSFDYKGITFHFEVLPGMKKSSYSVGQIRTALRAHIDKHDGDLKRLIEFGGKQILNVGEGEEQGQLYLFLHMIQDGKITCSVDEDERGFFEGRYLAGYMAQTGKVRRTTPKKIAAEIAPVKEKDDAGQKEEKKKQAIKEVAVEKIAQAALKEAAKEKTGKELRVILRDVDSRVLVKRAISRLQELLRAKATDIKKHSMAQEDIEFPGLHRVMTQMKDRLDELEAVVPADGTGSSATLQQGGPTSTIEAIKDISQTIDINEAFPVGAENAEALRRLAERMRNKIEEVSREIARDKSGTITKNKIAIIPGGAPTRTMVVTITSGSDEREVGIYQGYIEKIQKLEAFIGGKNADDQKAIIDSIIEGSVLHEIGHGFEGFSHLDVYSLRDNREAAEHWGKMVGYDRDLTRSLEERIKFSEAVAELNMGGKGAADYVKNKGAYLFYKFVTVESDTYIGHKDKLAESVRDYFAKYPHYMYALRYTTLLKSAEEVNKTDDEMIEDVVDEVLRDHDIFFGEGTTGSQKGQEAFTEENKEAGSKGYADIDKNLIIMHIFDAADAGVMTNDVAVALLAQYGKGIRQVIKDAIEGESPGSDLTERLIGVLIFVDSAIEEIKALVKASTSEGQGGDAEVRRKRARKALLMYGRAVMNEIDEAFSVKAIDQSLADRINPLKKTIFRRKDPGATSHQDDGEKDAAEAYLWNRINSILSYGEEFADEAKAIARTELLRAGIDVEVQITWCEMAIDIMDGIAVDQFSTRDEKDRAIKIKALAMAALYRHRSSGNRILAWLNEMAEEKEFHYEAQAIAAAALLESAYDTTTQIQRLEKISEKTFEYEAQAIAAWTLLKYGHNPERQKFILVGSQRMLMDLVGMETPLLAANTIKRSAYKTEAICYAALFEGNYEKLGKILEKRETLYLEAQAVAATALLLRYLHMKKIIAVRGVFGGRIIEGQDTYAFTTTDIEDIMTRINQIKSLDISPEGGRKHNENVAYLKDLLRKPTANDELTLFGKAMICEAMLNYVPEEQDNPGAYQIVIGEISSQPEVKSQTKEIIDRCEKLIVGWMIAMNDMKKAKECKKVLVRQSETRSRTKDPRIILGIEKGMKGQIDILRELAVRNDGNEYWANVQTSVIAHGEMLKYAGEEGGEHTQILTLVAASSQVDSTHPEVKDQALKYFRFADNVELRIGGKKFGDDKASVTANQNDGEEDKGPEMMAYVERARAAFNARVDYCEEPEVQIETRTELLVLGANPEEQIEKLEGILEKYDLALERQIQVYAAFLEVGHEPERQKERLKSLVNATSLSGKIRIYSALALYGEEDGEQNYKNLLGLIVSSSPEQKKIIGTVMKMYKEKKMEELDDLSEKPPVQTPPITKEEDADSTTSGQDDGELETPEKSPEVEEQVEDEVKVEEAIARDTERTMLTDTAVDRFIDFIVNIGPKDIPDAGGIDNDADITAPKDEFVWGAISDILNKSDIGLVIESDFDLDKKIEAVLRGKGRGKDRRKLDIGVKTFSNTGRPLKTALRLLRDSGKKNIVILTLDANGVPKDILENAEAFKDTLLFNMQSLDEEAKKDDNMRLLYQSRMIMSMLIAATAKVEENPGRRKQKIEVLKYLVAPYLKDGSENALNDFMDILFDQNANVVKRFGKIVNYILSFKPVRAFNKREELDVMRKFWTYA